MGGLVSFLQRWVPRVPLRWALWTVVGGWVLVALALIVSTTLLASSMERLARDLAARMTVAELETELLAYGQVGELARGGWTPDLERLRGRSEGRLDALLGDLAARVGDPAEAALIAAVGEHVESVADTIAAARGGGAAANARRGEELTQALASVEALERYQDAAIRDARRHAAVVDRVANTIGGIALGMVLLVPLAFLAERRFVSRPLGGIAEAIRQLRLGGQAPPRAPEQGAAELSHIARTLNETAEALAAQHRAQLAFVAGVAHDLRTPIGTLRTSAGVIAKLFEDSDDPRVSRTVAMMMRQTERLSRMVDDLLDASRIESGELRLTLERVDARDVARRCVDLFEGASAAHEVTLAASPEPAPIDADPWRIEQVVVNLLENAIKYSPAGGPVVVDVRRRGEDVVLCVSDRGGGIPPGQLANLFEPFRRGALPAANVPGSGLGLSIVRRIVTAHGGSVEVDSAPERGTTFCVRLPAANADAPAAGAGAGGNR